MLALVVGFTLPRTRLAHDHLRLPKTRTSYYSHHLNQSALWEIEWFFRPLGYNLESLSNYIHYNTTIKSRQESHGITFSSYHIHILTPNPYVISSIIFSCQCTTNKLIHNSFHTKHLNISVSLYHIKHT